MFLKKKWLLIYHNLMYGEMNPGPQGITHMSHQAGSVPLSSLPYQKTSTKLQAAGHFVGRECTEVTRRAHFQVLLLQ